MPPRLSPRTSRHAIGTTASGGTVLFLLLGIGALGAAALTAMYAGLLAVGV